MVQQVIANFGYLRTHLLQRETITNETVYQLSVYHELDRTKEVWVHLDIAISAEDLMISEQGQLLSLTGL